MQINISAKILGVSVVLVAVMVGLSVHSIITVDRIEDRLAITAGNLIPLAGTVSAIEVAALKQESLFSKMLQHRTNALADSQTQRDEWQSYAQTIAQAIAEARHDISVALSDSDHQEESVPLARFDVRFEDLRAEYDDTILLSKRILDHDDAGNYAITDELLEVLAAEEEQFDRKLREIRVEATNLARSATIHTAEQERQARISTLITTGAGAFLGLMIASAITRGIVAPVKRLLGGFEKVEVGELNIALDVTSRDEIGRLTKGFNHMVGEIRAKEEIKDTFGRYIDPRIVEKIIENKDRAAMDGEKREMTVFFSDVANFTTISEMLTPSALVRLLNAYFTYMGEDIRATGGIIDKFIGDAIMAYWGPPFVSQDNMASAACLAALGNISELDRFCREIPDITGLRADPPSIQCRIGLATGPVVAGNIGSDLSKNYTVMGDTVNLGARLEGANKIYGTQILACRNTYAAARNKICFREIDLLTVKGKSEPTAIYEPLGPVESTPPPRIDLTNLFHEGIYAYRAQSWDHATDLFEECLMYWPEDGPSRTYIARIETLRGQSLPDDWDGVWRLTEK